jgi:hypothetical protein
MLEPFTGFRYDGLGDVAFSDGRFAPANFSVQLHKNGIIAGELDFSRFDFSLWSYLKDMPRFSLTGQENQSNRALLAEKCYLTGLNEANRKCTFGSREVIIGTDLLDNPVKQKFHLHYGIVNLYEAFGGACVDTELGKLRLVNFTDIKESEKLMSLYHMPLITSGLQLMLEPSPLQSLRMALENASNIARNFLKVSSLAQTIRHDWAFLEVSEVFDKVLDEEIIPIRPVLHILRSPVPRSPYIRMNAPAVYFERFVRSAWEGYSTNIEENYGFDMALEWYIKSNSGGTLETRFLAATTCLELLMEKFHSQNSTDKLFEEGYFKNFYENMKAHATELLMQMGVDEKTMHAVFGSMKGMERRTFIDKLEMLLGNWDISYADLGVTLSEIRNVRNKITHEGRYYNNVENQSQVDYLFRVYNGLFNILTRLFLALLRYRGLYYDIPNSKWIDFGEVCSHSRAHKDDNAKNH